MIRELRTISRLCDLIYLVMEFFITLIQIGGTLIAILLLMAIIGLFFKRFRKMGLITLVGLVLLLTLTAVYFLSPRTYDRPYLAQQAQWEGISIREAATEAGIYIGAAVHSDNLYRSELLNSFNSLTPEVDLKLGHLFENEQVGTYDFSTADSIVEYALSNGIRVRGHTLVWGKLSAMFKAPDLDAYLEDFPEAERSSILKNLVDTHIKTVLSHYKGKIPQWDVVNEPLEIMGDGELEENVYLKYLGASYIADAFQLAHETDPDLQLVLNEILFNYQDERAEGFYQLVKQLQADGVPIHGVGLQSHILYTIPSIEALRVYIKRFTDLGLEVELTEVDARLRLFGDAEDPYHAQAEFYGELVQTCLDNPGCTGITFWGISDQSCWMDGQMIFPAPNEPFFYDAEYRMKPVMRVLATILTNAKGSRETIHMVEPATNADSEL